eukprot:TRINITY_DN7443_c0_g1_i1.p1 TRINITY_DN7443_c0_g1~~TRINITY_DN7443_c0_g1_i1.p1  ORF type:complete len:396 (+),score=59.31 TRINITY_DN7443_c0_g1_i1:86-1273(+)
MQSADARARAVVERESVSVRAELSKLKKELGALERMEDDLVNGREVLSGQSLMYKVQKVIGQQQNVSMAINTVPEFFSSTRGDRVGVSNGPPPPMRAANRAETVSDSPPPPPLRSAGAPGPPVRRGTAVPPSSGSAPAPPPRGSTRSSTELSATDILFDSIVSELVSQQKWPKSICEIAARATGCGSLAAAEDWIKSHPKQVAIAARAESAVSASTRAAAVSAVSPRVVTDTAPPAAPPRQPPPRQPPPQQIVNAQPRPAPPDRRPAPPPPRGVSRPQPRWMRDQTAATAAAAPAASAVPPPAPQPAESDGPLCRLTVRGLKGAPMHLHAPADAPLTRIHQQLMDREGSESAASGGFLLSVPYPRRTIPFEEMATTSLRKLGLHPNGVLNMVPLE